MLQKEEKGVPENIRACRPQVLRQGTPGTERPRESPERGSEATDQLVRDEEQY